MAEFTPITTQEEFDAKITERISRAKESTAKQFEGWTSPDDLEKIKADYDAQIKTLQDAAADVEKTLADKDAQIQEGDKYRVELAKTRICIAAQLDPKYASRLVGDSEEDWKKDAEELAKDFAASHRQVPLGNSEPKPTDNNPKSVARRKFAEWMKEQQNK